MAEKIVIEIELPDSIIEALREALDLPPDTEETEAVPAKPATKRDMPPVKDGAPDLKGQR